MWFIVVLIVAIVQTSLINFNLLMIVAGLWGLNSWWGRIFILGLLVDLVDGTRLGLNSLLYLSLGLIAYLIKQWLPRRISAIKLKL